MVFDEFTRSRRRQSGDHFEEFEDHTLPDQVADAVFGAVTRAGTRLRSRDADVDDRLA
jgi:hypothetical protein